MKVFSKKKAADRAQHNLRTFSVPLRPQHPSPLPPTLSTPAGAEAITSEASGTGTGGAEGGAGAGAGAADAASPIVKITVPANLPVDADDVVERLKCSAMAFKQVRTRVAPERGLVVDGLGCGGCDAFVLLVLPHQTGYVIRRAPPLPALGLTLAHTAQYRDRANVCTGFRGARHGACGVIFRRSRLFGRGNGVRLVVGPPLSMLF